MAQDLLLRILGWAVRTLLKKACMWRLCGSRLITKNAPFSLTSLKQQSNSILVWLRLCLPTEEKSFRVFVRVTSPRQFQNDQERLLSLPPILVPTTPSRKKSSATLAIIFGRNGVRFVTKALMLLNGAGRTKIIQKETSATVTFARRKPIMRRRLAPIPVRYKRSWHELRLLRRTRCKSFPHGLMWKASSLDCLWTTKHWPKPLTSRTAWCGVLLRAQGVVQTQSPVRKLL